MTTSIRKCAICGTILDPYQGSGRPSLYCAVSSGRPCRNFAKRQARLTPLIEEICASAATEGEHTYAQRRISRLMQEAVPRLMHRLGGPVPEQISLAWNKSLIPVKKKSRKKGSKCCVCGASLPASSNRPRTTCAPEVRRCREFVTALNQMGTYGQAILARSSPTRRTEIRERLVATFALGLPALVQATGMDLERSPFRYEASLESMKEGINVDIDA